MATASEIQQISEIIAAQHGFGDNVADVLNYAEQHVPQPDTAHEKPDLEQSAQEVAEMLGTDTVAGAGAAEGLDIAVGFDAGGVLSKILGVPDPIQENPPNEPESTENAVAGEAETEEPTAPPRNTKGLSGDRPEESEHYESITTPETVAGYNTDWTDEADPASLSETGPAMTMTRVEEESNIADLPNPPELNHELMGQMSGNFGKMGYTHQNYNRIEKEREAAYERGRGPTNAIQAGLSMQQQIQELQEDFEELKEKADEMEGHLTAEQKRYFDHKQKQIEEAIKNGNLEKARDLKQEYENRIEEIEEKYNEQQQDFVTGVKAYKQETNGIEETTAPLFTPHPAIGQSGNASESKNVKQNPDVEDIEATVKQKLEDIQDNILEPLDDKLAEMSKTIDKYEQTVNELKDQLGDTYGPRARGHFEHQLEKAQQNLEKMQNNYETLSDKYNDMNSVLDAGQQVDIQSLHDALADDGTIDLQEWNEITSNINDPEALAEIAKHLEGKLGDRFSDKITEQYAESPAPDVSSDSGQQPQQDTTADRQPDAGADAQPNSSTGTAGNMNSGSAASEYEPLQFQSFDFSLDFLSKKFKQAHDGETSQAKAQQEQTQDHENENSQEPAYDTHRTTAGPGPSRGGSQQDSSPDIPMPGG